MSGATAVSRPSAAEPPGPLWKRAVLPTYVLVVLAVTLVPIIVMIVYSLNQAPNERLSFAWQGFTTEWYRRLFEIPDLTSALVTSLEIAALSTVIAVAIGTPAALALARYRFRGRGLRRSRHPRRHRRPLGRRRRLAARPVRLSRRQPRLRDDPDRPCRLQRRLRRHRPAGAAPRHRPVAERGRPRPRLEPGAGLLARHHAGHLPGDPLGLAARRGAVDRRLHHHQLRRRPDADLPALGLRLGQGRDPARRSSRWAR